jgi:hypothetical protein
MNQRIKKLAEQAGINLPDDSEYNGHIYKNAVERFAGLIVAECLEQIDKIRDGCEADNEGQQALGADWAGLAVARHFGVE